MNGPGDQAQEHQSRNRREQEIKHLRKVATDAMTLIFETLQALFAQNPSNQFYIERKMYLDAIVNRLAYGLGAEDCFAALISSNYELLKKVDAKILRKSRKHHGA